MQFQDLNLVEALITSLVEQGYEKPTPIQEQAIPPILQGRDMLASAHTGTGKTAAFALPILQRLAGQPRQAGLRRRPIRALILAPTRELAMQIGQSFKAYGGHIGLKYACVFGGVQQRYQVYALQKGVDILIATPGRLLDLIGQGLLKLDSVQTLVLDEADRMLDMGFLPDITEIAKVCPEDRQTLLFSATLPSDIQALAGRLLKDPVEVRVAPPKSTLAQVLQQVYFVETENKVSLLLHILQLTSASKVLVFTNTKVGADRLATALFHNRVRALSLHSGKTQLARMSALEGFKAGRVRVLIATDVASRGLDVDDITHVVNFELPLETEAYVHRIGRTGRAAKEGEALTLCASEERHKLQMVERLLGSRLSVVQDHPFPSTVPFREVFRSPRKRPLGTEDRPGTRNSAKPRGSARGNRGTGANRGTGGCFGSHERRQGKMPHRDSFAGPREARPVQGETNRQTPEPRRPSEDRRTGPTKKQHAFGRRRNRPKSGE